MELSAYKCHAFLDWRFIADPDGKWKAVYESLNGAGYWAIQAKWDEMFAVKEGVKVEKKKRVTRKKAVGEKKVAGKKENVKQPRAKKSSESIDRRPSLQQ